MKSTALKYVGIDVHQATLVIVILNELGRELMNTKILTNTSAVREFFASLSGTLHIAFEEGAQSQWLFDLLTPFAARVVVCDPRKIAIRGSKGDRVDARRLAELLRLGALRSIYHGNDGLTRLKNFVRSYQALVNDTTRVMQRIKAIFRSRAIGSKTRSVYHPSKRGFWLEQLDRSGGLRYRAEQLFTELDLLRSLRADAKREMLKEAKRHRAFRILCSMPRFGPIRSAQILAIIGNPFRFRTKRQLWPYAGLAVVTWSSGEFAPSTGGFIRVRSPKTRGLNRNYSRSLKSVLKAAAIDAARFDGPFRTFYKQLLERGMRPEMARLTLARKLAAILLAIWKKGERFDPTRLTLQPD